MDETTPESELRKENLHQAIEKAKEALPHILTPAGSGWEEDEELMEIARAPLAKPEDNQKIEIVIKTLEENDVDPMRYASMLAIAYAKAGSPQYEGDLIATGNPGKKTAVGQWQELLMNADDITATHLASKELQGQPVVKEKKLFVLQRNTINEAQRREPSLASRADSVLKLKEAATGEKNPRLQEQYLTEKLKLEIDYLKYKLGK